MWLVSVGEMLASECRGDFLRCVASECRGDFLRCVASECRGDFLRYVARSWCFLPSQPVWLSQAVALTHVC